MLSRIKRVCFMLFLTVMVIGVGVFIAPAISEVPECELAFDWVNSHREDLPQTIGELSSFPVSYRVAVFNALPPETKSRLWTEKLETFLAGTPQLTPAQKAVIEMGIGVTTPEAYTTKKGSIEWALIEQRLEQIQHRALQAFSENELFTTFFVLGTPDPTYELAATWPILLRRTMRNLFTASAFNCSCSRRQSFCFHLFASCQVTGCTPTERGCGWFFLARCDGQCREP